MILQIQDNGIDLEEEGGDDFVDIDDMLLDELDFEELDLSGLLRRLLMTATATAATTARTVAATAAATAATTQPRKRERTKSSGRKGRSLLPCTSGEHHY